MKVKFIQIKSNNNKNSIPPTAFTSINTQHTANTTPTKDQQHSPPVVLRQTLEDSAAVISYKSGMCSLAWILAIREWLLNFCFIARLQQNGP